MKRWRKKMRPAAVIFSVTCIIFALNAGDAFADCMSCISATGTSYTELACDGDTEYEVIHKCGAPDYTEEGETVTTGQFGSEKAGKGQKQGGFIATTEKIKRFYYNCGEGRFVKILVFRNGVLVDIRNGDRGTGNQRCW
ncbi:MAG: DUF2845 domain-containing protein [Candidatus Sulfobium sp.]|jgi:hypothetical protein